MAAECTNMIEVVVNCDVAAETTFLCCFRQILKLICDSEGWNSCSDQCLSASSAASFLRNSRRNKVRFLGGDLKIDALIFNWTYEDKSWSFHATQGPLPNTCGSFWEMVWEQKSRGVVMLNRVVEKGSVSGCLLLTVHLLPGYPVCHAEVKLSVFLLRCLLRTCRSNVPSTGLSGRRETASSRIQTSSSLSSQKTSNPTTQSVSWSWKTWPWVLEWCCLFVNVCMIGQGRGLDVPSK